MENIFIALPGNETLTRSLAEKCNAPLGDFEFRNFPDGETYVKINSDVKNKCVIFVCTLNHPDEKIMLLYFLSQTVKDSGAKKVSLIAPYLAYMRQDKRFQEGEGITSDYFAKLLSSFTDSLTTIDPHLHRRNSLSEIYSIPTHVLHAAGLISAWIKKNIKQPVLVGPDIESRQWVSKVALEADAPFIVLEKIRHSDTEVEVSFPQISVYKNHTPVLVDDIISTATTMIETIHHLKGGELKKPVCIGIHGIFAGNAYNDLRKAGAGDIITCNTIPHKTNRISIDELLYSVIY